MSEELDYVIMSDVGPSLERISWEQTHRVGVAEYDPETSEIRLWVLPNDMSYSIDLEREKPVEQWLEHLNGKRWATSEVLGDFIKCWLNIVDVYSPKYKNGKMK